jgi:hypothetical protein
MLLLALYHADGPRKIRKRLNSGIPLASPFSYYPGFFRNTVVVLAKASQCRNTRDTKVPAQLSQHVKSADAGAAATDGCVRVSSQMPEICSGLML